MAWVTAYLLGYLACCVLFYRDSGHRPLLAKHNRWILSASLCWPIWAIACGSERAQRWWHKRSRR